LLSVKSDNSSTKNSEIGDKVADMPAAPLNVQISHDDNSVNSVSTKKRKLKIERGKEKKRKGNSKPSSPKIAAAAYPP